MPADIPDLTDLAALLRDQPLERALPSSLPDAWLHQVCADLRGVAALVMHDAVPPSEPKNWPGKPLARQSLQAQILDVDPSRADALFMARPLLLLVHIFAARTGSALRGSVAMAAADLPELFGCYQFLCEREIVDRVVGVPSASDVEGFLELVDRAVQRAAAS